MSENNIKAGTAAFGAGPSTSTAQSAGGSAYSIARVIDVVYVDADRERFAGYIPGKTKSDFEFGDVACYTFINNQEVRGIPIIAKPVHANITRYPVKDELIKISALPTYKASTPAGNYEPQYYYSDIINTWGAAEHNSVPQEGNHSSGPTVFNETGKVKKLIQGPGDITYEGRSGNSMRFASTIPKLSGFPWSGPERQPLTIIRNGQKVATGLEQVFEDINKDGSSFYMLYGHNVGFEPSSLNFDSYKEKMAKTVKSNIIEPKTPDAPLPAQTPAASDATVAKDTPPVALPVNVQAQPNSNDLAAQDEFILPDNDKTEYVQETQYIAVAPSTFNDLLPSSFSISSGTTYIGSELKVDRNIISNDIKKGNYKNLSIIDAKSTPISKNDLSNIINSFISNNTISKIIGHCVMAIAINEQSRGDNITGYNFNHFGIQTDGSPWSSGRFNIQFNGQYYAKDSQRGRMFASFASDKEVVLFISAALERKGFTSVVDASSFARQYIDRWWSPGINVSTQIFNEKAAGFTQASKYIK